MSTVDHPALRSDAQANQVRILAAARQVFADRGLDAKLVDVAEAAGVGVGTIYRRFTNKEGLIDALFASRLRELVAVATVADEMDNAWDGLVYTLREGSKMMAQDHGLRDLIMPSPGRTDPLLPLTSLTEDVVAARLKLIDLSNRIVLRARESGELRADFEATDIPLLIIAVQAGADFARPHTDEMWQRMLGFAIDGLRSSRTGITAMEVPALTSAEMDQAIGVDQTSDHRSDLAQGRGPGVSRGGPRGVPS